ncbi:MAG: hypothetical protein PVH87_11365 [Desulfobacteraceae bacterium]|jgi:hypothetical protein
MLGEFVHAGRRYIIKNRTEPVAEDEWPFEFETFKEAQFFFQGAIGSKFSRNEMLEIAAFFLPFACQQDNGGSEEIQEQQLQLLVQELLEGSLVLLCKKPSKMAN